MRVPGGPQGGSEVSLLKPLPVSLPLKEVGKPPPQATVTISTDDDLRMINAIENKPTETDSPNHNAGWTGPEENLNFLCNLYHE